MSWIMPPADTTKRPAGKRNVIGSMCYCSPVATKRDRESGITDFRIRAAGNRYRRLGSPDQVAPKHTVLGPPVRCVASA